MGAQRAMETIIKLALPALKKQRGGNPESPLDSTAEFFSFMPTCARERLK
jgi:hypothetical protein